MMVDNAREAILPAFKGLLEQIVQSNTDVSLNDMDATLQSNSCIIILEVKKIQKKPLAHCA